MGTMRLGVESLNWTVDHYFLRIRYLRKWQPVASHWAGRILFRFGLFPQQEKPSGPEKADAVNCECFTPVLGSLCLASSPALSAEESLSMPFHVSGLRPLPLVMGQVYAFELL